MSSVLGISLPADWSSAPLKHVTTYLNRGSAPTYVGEGAVRAISQATNQAAGLDWTRTRFHEFGGDPRKLKGFLRPDDVLINSTGTGTLGRVGYFTQSPDGLPCMADSHVTVARAKLDELDSRFMYYWLSSRPFQEFVYAVLVVGATNQIELNRDRLGDAPVPIPKLEEQRRIAEFLDTETERIDALRVMRERQNLLLEERMEAIWSTVISRDGKDTTWAPIRRFVVSITDGPFGSSLTSSHYSADGARVIRLGNLGRAEFRDRDPAHVPLEYFANLRRHEAIPGDLIVAGLGDQNHPLGRACVVPDDIGPAMVKADCFRLRLDQGRILHEYASWVLSSRCVADQVALLARGSTRARINLEVAREIPIPVPSLERQRRTVEELKEHRAVTRAVTDRCRRQLSLLVERRQALIAAAVTGQFDVSTASGRNVTEGITA
ncbi:restriction endonuclease subunit S [Streptomyces sp. NPDC051577]|uniref:restriction endonuclease subunit S n=1 Tax=Streptomyces sp. NPDC051577 TaxID=3155166 RepID=UPI00343E3C87